jgi:hypothetical protein
MGDDVRQDETGLQPEGMKKAKGYDEETEGHMRLREVDPEALKRRAFDEDTEGHIRARASDGPEMEPEGLSNHRKAADDEDTEGHARR